MPLDFSLRRDRLGLRPVFTLGNLSGCCPFDCTFCDVKATKVTTLDEARKGFWEQWSHYQPQLSGAYHPLIYNGGNVTNPAEFSPALLREILEFFRGDERVQYVSVNSREVYATRTLLDGLSGWRLPFPIHFIFGLETSAEEAKRLLGKRGRGEFRRFVRKLARFNSRGSSTTAYTFGLDVNLLFLPELCIRESQMGVGKALSGSVGLAQDVENVLRMTEYGPPIQINIHPYCEIDELPLPNAKVVDLMAALPKLQMMLDNHNRGRPILPVYLFVGIEGKGYETLHWQEQARRWEALINDFNATGFVDPRYQRCLPRTSSLPN